MNSLSLELDPTTKDYQIENGGIKNDKTLKMPAYFRLMVRRRQWMYAPNEQFGSEYYLLKKIESVKAPTKVVSVAERALQPLIDQGRADLINVDITDQARGAAALEIDIRESIGDGETKLLTPIGE